ncbi:hypothetical protein IWW37_001627 [Coemansia sp. RSA 2050]|nr:hypothetical protein IWW37_001627 [Coemansia sp. RSA 2050]KAJ2729578.1 hypothetical protein IW152_005566 [Coemansia sp. BCRC 34962]
MSSKSLPCTHFDTPEGRWTLASEFTTEDAANQFMPHIGRDSCADDLCLGASGTETQPTPPTNGTSGMRFSAASSAMASSGMVFADNSPQVSSRATSAVTASIPKSNLHMLANRPTQVSIFRVAGAEPSVPVGDGGGEGTSNSSPVVSKGFRGGRMYLSKAAGALGGSSGALPTLGGGGGSLVGSQGLVAAAHSKGIVTKSTSAFVGRIVTNENLARWIVGDNQHSTYLMFNAPRCMTWIGLQPECSGEALARFDLVSNTPLSHDINQSTRAENRLDVVMGFVHGNIIWYDPISGKYSRLNKNSGYTPAIVCVRWIPGSGSLFMAGTADGSVMIMDRTKDDFCVPPLAHSNRRMAAMEGFEVAGSLKPKCNPVAFWKLGNKPVTCMAFSPDGQRVAIGSEDGGLRIVDYLNEILEDVYLSYFGGFTCCAWSDDGRYVVAGGKDDLITIWSVYDQSVVARCQGHESWVRDIAFDPMGHEDESTYRFMSVGDDAKLLVWDFSLAALHRPRMHRSGAAEVDSHLPGCPGVEDGPSDVVHPRMPRAAVAVLQPLMAVAIHDSAICSMQFSLDLLVTACRRGIIKVWKRPATFDLSSYI